MKAISKVFDVFCEKIINEHVESREKENRNKDFVDVMLGIMGSEETEYCIERDSVKAIMLYALGLQKVRAGPPKLMCFERIANQQQLRATESAEMQVEQLKLAQQKN
ncbi:hypothetical protein ACOSP7_022028 [Xanthoceras sorbifolium]